ncbi:MAG: HAD-IC family P-type ATPase [Myxococcota bacterium]
MGLLRGQPWLEVLLSAVALAVAAVPEGLPAVVTIAMAVGVRRMAARRVLVRRLPAVETLGAVTVVCTDKTGTLTTGRMRVREVRCATGVTERRLLEVAAACTDAQLRHADEDDHHDDGVGDPTELALLLAARSRGIERDDLDARWPRVWQIPFDSERKRMSVVRTADGVDRIYVKGALATVAPLCSIGWDDAARVEQGLAADGLRVLAVAEGVGRREEGLRLLGLVGIADPPRASAVAAVAAARRAGIRTVMLTGDHAETATAIARELGLVRRGEDPEQVVRARVTPADKLDVVRALTEQGEVVAMTGDGVNDAPAIREAHVGVAMGSGTEVTREAASIVIADDHFASLIEGVREGRAVYDNIRKTVTYLVAGNGAELAIVLVASVAGLPAPLLPVQLLWINLVTDGLPALALVVDPPDRDTMLRPPRDPQEPMLGRGSWGLVGISGALEAAAVLTVYLVALGRGDVEVARTLGFSTLVCSELLRAFAFRSRARVMPEVGLFSNLPLLFVVALSLGLQVAITELAFPRSVLHLAPLSPAQWAVALGAALVPVSVLEIGKLVVRALHRD